MSSACSCEDVATTHSIMRLSSELCAGIASVFVFVCAYLASGRPYTATDIEFRFELANSRAHAPPPRILTPADYGARGRPGAVGGWRAWRWCWRWSKEDRKGGAVVGAARRPAGGDVELSRHRRGRRDERRRLRTTMSQLPMLMALLRTMRSTWRSPQA